MWHRARTAVIAAMVGVFGWSSGASAQAVAQSWTGMYLGANVGAGIGHADWRDISLTAEAVRHRARGALGGGQIGYNYQSGQFVFGAELTLSASGVDDATPSTVVPATVTYGTSIDWFGTAGLRAGVALSPPLMVYAKAGVGFGRISVAGLEALIPDALSNKTTETGLMLGGGLEFMLSRNWSMGVDYTYINFGKSNFTGLTANGFAYVLTDSDVVLHAVTARLNYRF